MLHWLAGEFITLLIMSLALGTDAFSVGIGLGLAGIRKLYIGYMSVLIGGLHILLPLIGLFIGRYLHGLIGDATDKIGAAILLLLGIQMLYVSYKNNGIDEQLQGISSLAGMLVFAFSVSVDALSAGFGLGLFDTPVVVAVFMMGACGLFMTAGGMLLGRRLGRKFGKYGNVVGGCVLLGLGCYFLM